MQDLRPTAVHRTNGRGREMNARIRHAAKSHVRYGANLCASPGRRVQDHVADVGGARR